MRALRYLLNCLLAEIPLPNNTMKVQSFLEFQEAFEVFDYLWRNGKCADLIKTDRHVKKQFNELLCHSEYGLCIYVLHTDKREWIVLCPDNFSLEALKKQAE